ncbi:MAG: CusA/CzcA family heavy metal efflux RND transporter [Pseudomonadota bacterium]
MIRQLIRWSIENRVMVLFTSIFVVAWGIHSLRQTPVDALPDLSDVQVIIKTTYLGQAPQVVEDQITYPLSTAMLSVPKAETVRGYSFFGDSYVYVIFEDATDLYWARSRVLEYLSQVASDLPVGAKPSLGPDATGVGWIYEYALVDRTGAHDLAQLRSIQDWLLQYELQTVPGVAEVATMGGMVRQYQVIVDPDRLRAYDIPLSTVKQAIQDGNMEAGGAVVEIAEAEYMVRSSGYLEGQQDLLDIPLMVGTDGVPVLIGDVADVQIGPQMRRGVVDLDGEGEVVGGVVVMRSGENASKTIEAVKKRLDELQASLPPGVEVIETYDRSALIERAVDNLQSKLVEEFLVVGLICAVFLFHFRSAAVILISLPIGILVAIIVMRLQGINANIMSLGGIAIAIGAMVDAGIVMIENVHKHFERQSVTDENRWTIIGEAASEVGPALFFSLLIITLSFLPIFTLEAQEGRLFAPLAYTKTYAMAAAAGLAVTLVPVLMGFFIRGRIRSERENPINRWLIACYRPVLTTVIRFPRTTIALSGFILVTGLWPASQLGSEFMPELDEGDIMYMPTTYPGISIDKARELLQQTNKLIRTLPEVERVFGKIGRADTATDPAPLTMIETVIQLKPREQWRAGMTSDGIRAELDRTVQIPGLTNAWVMPIKTRIDMLATGIKTPVGIKIAGPELTVIQHIGQELERIVKTVPGTASVYSERVAGGRYVDIDIDRRRAARYGLGVSDIQDVVRSAIGGMNVTESVEGLERYPVNVRYPQQVRDSIQQIRLLPIVTQTGARVALADVATIDIADGPPFIKSENARPNGWTYVDIADRDLGSYVTDAQSAVRNQLDLPAGYSISWSGQYEYMVRAKERLMIVGPLTLAIIVMLLYMSFGRLSEVGIILGTLPMALVGGFWLMYFLGYELSVAVGVGFIALAGIAVELGIVMLIYLNQAIARTRQMAEEENLQMTLEDIRKAVVDGAVLRVRPIMMTVLATIAGLLPIMLGDGTGSEVMKRIAAPIVGGMVSATVLSLVVIPAFYLVWTASGLRYKTI